MHEPVTEHIEAYLAGSDDLPSHFTAHLDACAPCRREVAELETQAALLRLLKPSAEAEPRAGFYGRVIDRIDAQRQSSMWSLFLEPAFGRRLAFASAALAVLMGFYLFSAETTGFGVASPRGGQAMFLPGEDQVAPVFGVTPDQDRGVILVDLATYRE